MKNGRKHTILIVDDTPENIDVLGGMLQQDYHIKFASNGRKALWILESGPPPDLILLDVMMPGLDGFETCRLIKEKKGLEDTPVVFISALGDQETKVRAFASGGVDYVDRPFWPEEVKARVATHIQLKDHKTKLANQLKKLRKLEGLRDDLVHMVVHDMRSPIGYLEACLKFLMEDGEGVFEEDTMENVKEAMSCAQKLKEMAKSLLDVSRMESGRMPIEKELCDLVKIVSEAAENPEFPFSGRKPKFERHFDSFMVECDPDLIRRVLNNLIGNALKFTPRDGEVEIELSDGHGVVRVTVKDTGEGIPEEFLDKIFNKFVSRQSIRRRSKYCSTGLGLAFCKLAVEAHGGEIGAKSELGVGSCFWFSLPMGKKLKQ